MSAMRALLGFCVHVLAKIKRRMLLGPSVSLARDEEGILLIENPRFLF